MEKLLTLNLTTQQTLRIMFGVGEIYMLSFRYDRLMSFCNKCGMLTHDVKECLLHTDEQYRPWAEAVEACASGPL